MELLVSCIQSISLLKPINKEFLKLYLSKHTEFSQNNFNFTDDLLETQANDEASVLLLDKKPIEIIVQYLLLYIPLFKQNYSNLKPLYQRFIERIYRYTTKFRDDDKIDLKDYYYIFKIASAHLAFDSLEQKDFNNYASKLQSKLNFSEINKDDSGFHSNLSNNLSNNTSNEIKKVDTVKSVTFADSSIKNSKDIFCSTNEMSDSSHYYHKTFSSKHAPLFRCQTDIQRNVQTHIGMTDVPTWLNFLRLHKYINTIAGLTYEEMMGITEEELRNFGLTQGAAGKMIREIEKLKNRPSKLHTLKQTTNFNDADELSNLVKELYVMSWTPMKRIYSLHDNEHSNNLASSFLSILYDVKEALKTFNRQSIESIVVEYIQLLDKLSSMNFFQDFEKKQLSSWRLEIIKLNENVKLKFVTPLKRILSLKTQSNS